MNLPFPKNPIYSTKKRSNPFLQKRSFCSRRFFPRRKNQFCCRALLCITQTEGRIAETLTLINVGFLYSQCQTSPLHKKFQEQIYTGQLLHQIIELDSVFICCFVAMPLLQSRISGGQCGRPKQRYRGKRIHLLPN